jgi:hypothetical protein
MISDVERNNGGSRSTNGSSGSGKMHPSSIGIRFGCIAQAAAQKAERSSPLDDEGATSKMRQEEPTMACVVFSDHACAGSGLKTTPVGQR